MFRFLEQLGYRMDIQMGYGYDGFLLGRALCVGRARRGKEERVAAPDPDAMDAYFGRCIVD